MDTVGAFLGPLLAMGLMIVFANDFRSVFWVALIPAVLSVICVLVGVEDAPKPAGEAPPPIRMADLKALRRPFWSIVGIGVVFTLARFSEAFLILRAADFGLPIALAPLVLVAMNIVYSAGAYPAGALADRYRPRGLLIAGMAVLIAADLLLAFGTGLFAVFAGIALWGAHMALTQGLMSKLVADAAPSNLRGSAFGLFNLASGVAMLVASVAAGLLWDALGPAATFIAGAVFATLTLLLLALRRR
jgi:predicted MFS family arabinose efflux permease